MELRQSRHARTHKINARVSVAVAILFMLHRHRLRHYYDEEISRRLAQPD
jgi:hypothetical protein